MTCKLGDITNFAVFAKVSTIGESLLVPFYISLTADISGTRKGIKTQSMLFFPAFPVLSDMRK